jgi:hypothetical protein
MDPQNVGWRHRLVSSCSGYGQVAGCCECGNEPSGSIKCEAFPAKLRACLLVSQERLCSTELLTNSMEQSPSWEAKMS